MEDAATTWSSHTRAQMLPKDRRSAPDAVPEAVKVIHDSVEKSNEEPLEPTVPPVAESDPPPPAEAAPVPAEPDA